ncbi:baseplate J/gp47 family protein [Aerococcus urinaeequi]|uniref:baseplate J/gp47 family protein n=1 Tax=Aerococcus urinaeequi TaxID=51665 RepID=UPI003D6B1648
MTPDEIGAHLETYDFNYYMEEALARVPTGVDTREGSIIYDALAPACYQLASFTMELRNTMLESYVVSATGEYLDLRAEEAGVMRIPATHAVVTASFTSGGGQPYAVDIGSRFSSIGDEPIYYAVTEKVSEGVYRLTAEESGSVGNEYVGVLLPLDNFNDFGQALLTEITVPARDDETDDSLRARVIAEKGVGAFGGNIEDYTRMITDLDGVGGVQVYPAWQGGGTVLLSIVNNVFEVPSQELVSEVQEAIDPEIGGSGVGLAPIGHKVTVRGPVQKVIDVSFYMNVESGANQTAIFDEAKTVIENYFLSVRQRWSNRGVTGYEAWIYRSQITSAILSIQGVANAAGIKLNGNDEDVKLELTSEKQELPILGTVSLS